MVLSDSEARGEEIVRQVRANVRRAPQDWLVTGETQVDGGAETDRQKQAGNIR